MVRDGVLTQDQAAGMMGGGANLESSSILKVVGESGALGQPADGAEAERELVANLFYEKQIDEVSACNTKEYSSTRYPPPEH